MNFRLLQSLYNVAIMDGAIHSADGSEQAGRCDWARRRIEISGSIPLDRRAVTLAHELWHGMTFECGTPRTEEDLANAVATFAMLFHRELTKHGGEPAVWRLVTQGTVEPSPVEVDQTWHMPATASGAECGVCHERFSVTQIFNSTPFMEPGIGRLVIRRTVYCDPCNHLQDWLEGATPAGAPNGRVLGVPTLRRGKDVADFLRQHGDKIGVVAA